jgi:hypothetical protein
VPTGGKPAGIGSWTSTPVSPEGSTRMRSLEGKLTWYHKDVHRKARLCGPSVGIASRRPVVNRSTSCSILAACPNHSLVKEVRGRSHPPEAFRNGETRHPTETSTHVNPHAHQISGDASRKRAVQPARLAPWLPESRIWLIRKPFFATLRPFS